MRAAQPFNPRLVIGLIVAGMAGFAALLLLIAYGGAPGSTRDGRATALSVSAIGFRGLVELVGAFEQTYLIRAPDDFDTENLVVIALEPQSRAEDLTRVLDQRRGRATLLILPKWATLPDPARRGWVRAIGPGTGSAAEQALGRDVDIRIARDAKRPMSADGVDILSGLSLPVPRSPQIISGKGVRPLFPLGDGALVAQFDDQPHYVVADPDLLNNQGLANPENARAALALIDGLNATDADGVDFDLTVNGLGTSSSQSLLRLSFEPPFLAMTLALVAAALLAGLHGAFRFGPVRREQRAIAFGKAALVENSAGLVRQADREARLGAAYADVIRQDAARLTAAPHGQSESYLDQYLSRLGRPDRPSFNELAANLRAARNRHSLMTAARALFEWKKEIIR